MKFRITVQVDGDAFSRGSFTTEYGRYTYGVSVDEKNNVEELYIETTLNENEALPSIKNGVGNIKLNINYRSPVCHEEMLEKLIYFESIGSFWWGIKSFNLNETKEEWIPEDNSDKEKLSLMGFSLKQDYRKNPRPLHDHQIKDLLELESLETPMIIPMAFYREANINFENHKYIIAFQNYFLMIEGLYGKGQSGTKRLVSTLLSSPEFVIAANKMLAKIMSDPDSKHFATFSKELSENRKVMNTEGLTYWLVFTRGQLMHFSVNSSKRQGSPLNHKDYRTHAYIASGIAVFIYSGFHTNILKERAKLKNQT